MGINTKQLTDYLDKMGIEYKIDTNPTEERIAEIKKKIKNNAQIRG